MGIRFKDIPKSKKFRTERKALFKTEDGMKSMLFSDEMKIKIKVSFIESEKAREELEALADRMLKEVQRIIAEHEAP